MHGRDDLNCPTIAASPCIRGPRKMADTLSKRARSERMSLVRGKNTKVELTVRSLVHKLGYRYGLHAGDIPGRPDLVFRSRRKVIFIHGCFWHNHSHASCKIARLPKSNSDYWADKLRRNVERDAVRRAELRRLGWKVLVIWECQAKSIEKHMQRIERFLT